MPVRDLLSDEGRQRATEAVRAVEARTSAEIVVAVRWRSDGYHEADYLLGFGCAVATLLALLYLPTPFAIGWFAVDVVAGFAVGVLLGRVFPVLRRWLISRSRLRETVTRSAKAAFVDLGVSRTKDRTGVLVYVSVYERLVEVVADVGVAAAVASADWDAVVGPLRASLRGRVDRDRLLTAVRRLGDVLEPALPRAEDDENELPDALNVSEEPWP